MNRFKLVAKAKLKKKRQAEREAKKGKRPKLPWQKAKDSAGTSLGAITEMSFKDFLVNEARYAEPSVIPRVKELMNHRIQNPDFKPLKVESIGIGDAKQAVKNIQGWTGSEPEVADEKYDVWYRWAVIYKGYFFEVQVRDFVFHRDLQPKISVSPPQDPKKVGTIQLRNVVEIFEATYYQQQEDWQDDVNEWGSAVGICPRCKGEARMTTEGDSLATARSFWECQECGHTGPEHRY
jgi:hypothetical protein